MCFSKKVVQISVPGQRGSSKVEFKQKKLKKSLNSLASQKPCMVVVTEQKEVIIQRKKICFALAPPEFFAPPSPKC